MREVWDGHGASLKVAGNWLHSDDRGKNVRTRSEDEEEVFRGQAWLWTSHIYILILFFRVIDDCGRVCVCVRVRLLSMTATHSRAIMFKLYSSVEAQPNQIIKWALLTRFGCFFFSFKSFSLVCATTTTAARDDDVTNSLRNEEEVEKIRILNLKRDPLIRQMNMNILKAKAIAWDFFFLLEILLRESCRSRVCFFFFPSFSLNSLFACWLMMMMIFGVFETRETRSICSATLTDRTEPEQIETKCEKKRKKEKKTFDDWNFSFFSSSPSHIIFLQSTSSLAFLRAPRSTNSRLFFRLTLCIARRQLSPIQRARSYQHSSSSSTHEKKKSLKFFYFFLWNVLLSRRRWCRAAAMRRDRLCCVCVEFTPFMNGPIGERQREEKRNVRRREKRRFIELDHESTILVPK